MGHTGSRWRWRGSGALVLALVGGCAPAGVVFPPLADAPRWPPPPEPARIVYVGQLSTDADLKPARDFFQGIAQAVFGKPDVHSMLTPFALCTDGGDRLFVADSNAQLVHVFDLKTRKYEQWKPGKDDPQFAQPVGVAWDPSGRLLVADSVAGAVLSFDAGGRFLGALGVERLKRPCGLAVHPAAGRIYVADAAAHQVVILSSSGQEIQRLGQRGVEAGQFNYPVAVAIDRQGRLYVSDALNFRVQQFSADLRTVRQIGAQGDMPGYFAQPKGIAVDGDDHLYVVDSQFEAVQVFSPEGVLLMDFGEEGRGPGQFWLPTHIFIDAKNRIWIADSYNQRIQVFDYKPENQP